MARGTELRVGIFVVAALVIGAFLAFVIGSRRNFFDPKTEYHAFFDSVDGLQEGNPVQIAGVGVGAVRSVEFAEDGRVEVHFWVVSSAAELIRGNPAENPPEEDEDRPQPSRISIGAKGLLGDKLLSITVGRGDQWPSEQPLFVAAGGDLMAMAEGVADEVRGTAVNLRQMTAPYAEEQFGDDVQQTVHNIRTITDLIANGEGTIPRLLRDEELADDTQATLRNIRVVTAEFARTARSARLILDEVREGDGTAHALVYGTDGRDALASIGQASGELATLLRDVRTGDGTMHDLLYGDAGDELIANLTQVSEDVAAITGDVRAGRGTLGGLLVDPSIYEDVKRLVGDLERNDVLRALVRYSIRRDEAAREVEVEEAAE